MAHWQLSVGGAWNDLARDNGIGEGTPSLLMENRALQVVDASPGVFELDHFNLHTISFIDFQSE
jgi:hypothetical protein